MHGSHGMSLQVIKIYTVDSLQLCGEDRPLNQLPNNPSIIESCILKDQREPSIHVDLVS